MNNDESKFWEILVQIPKYDKEGNIIPRESMSSGGARNAAGQIIAQYGNPRIPEPTNTPEAARNFNKGLSREYDARRGREDAAEERRRKNNAAFAMIVGDVVVKPIIEQFIIPLADEWLYTKVLPGCEQLARRWLHSRRSQSEVPRESGDAPKLTATTVAPLASSQYKTAHMTKISTEQEDREDGPIVEVIQLDEYQNRRSA